MAYAYSLSTWIVAHTAALAEMLDDTTSAPKIRVYSATPTLLAEFTIADTSSVSGTTGGITIDIDEQEDAALAEGTASYATIVDGDDTVHLRLDCQQGTVPVPGACVINTLSITAGAAIQMLSVLLPAGPTI